MFPKTKMVEVRKAIESMYDCTCDVYEYTNMTNTITKKTTQEEIMVIQRQPCRLSTQTISQAMEGGVSAIVKVTKLFLSPEITINEGSKIVVTKNGAEEIYRNSGIPGRFTNHQEIILEAYDRRA